MIRIIFHTFTLPFYRLLSTPVQVFVLKRNPIVEMETKIWMKAKSRLCDTLNAKIDYVTENRKCEIIHDGNVYFSFFLSMICYQPEHESELLQHTNKLTAYSIEKMHWIWPFNHYDVDNALSLCDMLLTSCDSFYELYSSIFSVKSFISLQSETKIYSGNMIFNFMTRKTERNSLLIFTSAFYYFGDLSCETFSDYKYIPTTKIFDANNFKSLIWNHSSLN